MVRKIVVILVFVFLLGVLVQASRMYDRNLLFKVPFVGEYFGDYYSEEVGRNFVYFSQSKVKKLLEKPENKGKVLLPVVPDESTEVILEEIGEANAVVVKNYNNSDYKSRLLINTSMDEVEYRVLDTIALFVLSNGVRFVVNNPVMVDRYSFDTFGKSMVLGFEDDENGKSVTVYVAKGDGSYGKASDYLLKDSGRWVVVKDMTK